MSQVFISYKREDEARVGRLVLALEKAGLSVWWDRGLAAGEQWRVNTEAALNAAGCVVVVWTEASVSAQGGGFVKDEATRALARRVLVPVLFDKVQPPLGFGELQAIDLVRWRGSRRDVFFQDLLAAINAKLAGKPVPAARGPLRQLARRLTAGSVATALLLSAAAFATNTLKLQDKACGVAVGQPAVSDACGALGLGGRATKEERLAWQARPAGDCQALRAHVARFTNGAYRAEAEALVNAKAVTSKEVVTPGERALPLFVGSDAPPAPTEPAARTAALARAAEPAQRSCRNFAAAGRLFEYRGARVQAQRWKCGRAGSGWACELEGDAICELGERKLFEVERCGEVVAGSKP